MAPQHRHPATAHRTRSSPAALRELPTAYCLLLVLVVALGIRLAFTFRAPPFVTNDSSSYLLPGFDLARGFEFAPLLKRPPLYPLFIGGAVSILGEEPRVLMLAQHLLGALTAIGAFSIGLLVYGRTAGFIAGLLTAVSGPLLVTEHYVMSESLFGALLVGGVLAYLVAIREDRLVWFGVAGSLIGLATLTRPIGQLVAAILLLGIPLLHVYGKPAQQGAPLRRSSQAQLAAFLCRGALFLCCFFVVVVPWMVRTAVVHGTFAVAGGIGEGLAVRTIRYDQRFDFRAAPGQEEDRLLARARRIYGDEANDGSAFELARRLREELNISEVQADRLMRDIALAAILRQPLYYIQGTAEMFARTFAGRPVRLRQDWTPWRNIGWATRVEHLLPSPTPTEDRAFPIAEALVSVYDPARVAPLVAILFGLGVCWGLKAQHRPALLLGALVLGPLLASAALIGVEWRYRYPLDPLISVLVAGGLVLTVRWLIARSPFPRRQRLVGQPESYPRSVV